MPLKNKNITVLKFRLSIFYLFSLVDKTTTNNENNNKESLFFSEKSKKIHPVLQRHRWVVVDPFC